MEASFGLDERRSETAAGLGRALLGLPVAFVLLVFLKYGAGVSLPFDALDAAFLSGGWRMETFNAVTPVLFLGGPLLAAVVNAAALVRGSVRASGRGLEGDFVARPRLANVLIITASCALFATFGLYALAENWSCWTGSATNC